MMAGFNRSSRAGEGQGLKTAKMREQEANQKAARLGPVPIRVQLPSGLTLQVKSPASQVACRFRDGQPAQGLQPLPQAGQRSAMGSPHGIALS